MNLEDDTEAVGVGTCTELGWTGPSINENVEFNMDKNRVVEPPEVDDYLILDSAVSSQTTCFSTSGVFQFGKSRMETEGEILLDEDDLEVVSIDGETEEWDKAGVCDLVFSEDEDVYARTCMYIED